MLCMCLRRVVPWKPSLLAASSFVAQRHLCLSNKIVFVFPLAGCHFISYEVSAGSLVSVALFLSFILGAYFTII